MLISSAPPGRVPLYMVNHGFPLVTRGYWRLPRSGQGMR
jgi:hypothetical protein